MSFNRVEFIRMVGRLFSRLGGELPEIKEIRLYATDDTYIIITKGGMLRFES